LLYDGYRGLGKQPEADAALESLAKLDTGGNTVAMIYNEGVNSLSLGDYKNAGTRFREALALQPDMAPALAGLALVQVNSGQFQEAADNAEKALAVDPEHKQALRIRYEACKGLGDKEKIAVAFQALAAVNPGVLAEELFNKGVEQFNGGDTAGAIESFELALQLEPQRIKAHYYLGLCNVNTGDSAKAREHLEKFIAEAPDDPDVGTAKEMLSFLE
jgi:tetratricopeptide (TPR) repeat protein